MNHDRFHEITRRYAGHRIAVIGDLCLDRYLEIDPGRQETSLETGLPVHNVINVRSQPGAAGTIINNLSARMTEANEKLAAEQASQGLERQEMTLFTLQDLKFPPQAILELVDLVESGKISNKIAQDVFGEVFATGESPAKIVEKKGLAQVSDTGAIEKFCDDAIAANPGPVADFKAGRVAALNFLKGQVMRLSKGKANPALVGEILQRKIQS